MKNTLRVMVALVFVGSDMTGAGTALAQAPDQPELPAAPEQRQAEPGTQTPDGRGEGIWDRANLFGDPGGLRSRLLARGVTLTLSETSEVTGNPFGGRQRQVTYAGLTRFGVQVDTGVAAGLTGGTFKASGFQVHGRGLGSSALRGDVNAVSNIEENRSTLLAELWYEQVVVTSGVTIRAGQIFADLEFMTSDYGGLFVASTFGWSTLQTTSLPNGGPIYPRAALGVRGKAQFSDEWTVLAGVFNGDPTGPDRADGRPRNANGTAFRLGDGVFAIAEVQYGLNRGEGATGLPGTYKLGGWYNSRRFDDRTQGSDGLPPADPLGNGQPASRRGNWSVYAVADQLVWREAGTTDQGLGVFARIMGGPGDRNLLNFYVDAGLSYKGLLPGRQNDTAGLGIAYSRFSDSRGRNDVGSGFPPVRRNETLFELTYQAAVTPWLQIQPLVQYLVNPSADPDPLRPDRRIRDALIGAVRMNLTF